MSLLQIVDLNDQIQMLRIPIGDFEIELEIPNTAFTFTDAAIHIYYKGEYVTEKILKFKSTEKLFKPSGENLFKILQTIDYLEKHPELLVMKEE